MVNAATLPASPAAPGETLLAWYDRHHRELAWRVSPRERAKGVEPDPYHIWLSEVMLQQTTVRAVDAYFRDFLRRWPTVEDLAASSEDEVMKAWAGLGYYSRARNLKKCADLVVAEHGGRFPNTFEGLRTLPGIGDYTAAAIAAIAFDRREPVVDGNIERVVSRLFAIDTPLPAAKAEIRARVAEIMPASRPGDFAQAMMDLGATICTPKRPACALCPVNDNCIALAEHDPERFPVKAPKKEKPVRLGAAFVAEDASGAVLIRRRPPSGLLGGMSEVPTTGWTARVDGIANRSAAPFAADWREAGTIRHVFTHFELRLNVFHAKLAARPAIAEGWWSPPEELPDEALPTVVKKAIAAALPDAFRRARHSVTSMKERT